MTDPRPHPTLRRGVRNGLIAGTVAGNNGTGLQLTNSTTGEVITVAKAATTFAFTRAVSQALGYAVAVTAQPTALSQTCAVSGEMCLKRIFPSRPIRKVSGAAVTPQSTATVPSASNAEVTYGLPSDASQPSAAGRSSLRFSP